VIRSYRLTVREEPLGDNRWRYELSCGHIIVRRAPGRVGCYCDECRNGWQAFCAWVQRRRPHVWTDAYSTELLRSLPFPA